MELAVALTTVLRQAQYTDRATGADVFAITPGDNMCQIVSLHPAVPAMLVLSCMAVLLAGEGYRATIDRAQGRPVLYVRLEALQENDA